MADRQFSEFKNKADQKDWDKAFQKMRENNDALHFYQRHNFVIIGQRPSYYLGANGQKFDALTFARQV